MIVSLESLSDDKDRDRIDGGGRNGDEGDAFPELELIIILQIMWGENAIFEQGMSNGVAT